MKHLGRIENGQDVVTKEYVDGVVEQGSSEVDPSMFATKEEVTNLQNDVIANEEVSAAAFNEINERIEQLSENVSGAAATKEELNNAVETITNSIIENEEITATALTDLDARIKEIIARLNALES